MCRLFSATPKLVRASMALVCRDDAGPTALAMAELSEFLRDTILAKRSRSTSQSSISLRASWTRSGRTTRPFSQPIAPYQARQRATAIRKSWKRLAAFL
jgi:hypothetical protein